MTKTIPERKRSKIIGRGKGYTFARLPHFVITSDEWRALSGSAIKFLIELSAQFNGKNNGDLSFTRRQALERGWNSTGTRDRAEREAIDTGFCLITRHGGRNTCNLYAITWEPMNDVGKGSMYPAETVASNRWRNARPQNGATLAPKQGLDS